MYPDFEYLFEKLFGIDAPGWLSIIKTFGFFVAIGFLAASWVLVRELRRREKMGWMQPEYVTVEAGKPATAAELLVAGLIGFLLGHKLGGFFGHWQEISPNPMAYIFSLEGSWLAGVAGAALMAYSKYAEKKKQQLPEPVTRQVAIYPHQRITEYVVAAMVAGLLGAKIFNAFESWDQFIQDPVGNLISSSGLTFYGGLIMAGIVIAWYARRHKIPVAHLADAFAPAMMLGYGVGRLGCHFSGDGDWGIFNSAYVSELSGALRSATPEEFLRSLHIEPRYLQSLVAQFGTAQDIPQLHAPAPSWLPSWLFGFNYPNNVNHEGMLISGCTGEYCAVLPVSVFPTALYEAIVCIGLFFVLWGLRKRLTTPLHLSGIYLILNGLERFFVEKIRVNYRYDWGILHPSQAEIISSLLVILGVLILVCVRKKRLAQT